eukprot:TRINITY_DN6020_c0_g1_i1.p1 TRINITY_DN6020_c0_g1~~TRINITY_DN6020_c0_g1_i1.p1  ORF type:complete len:269 (-),score=48.00 TRINITY_DN6020_c0_g1_i1:48-854(-)
MEQSNNVTVWRTGDISEAIPLLAYTPQKPVLEVMLEVALYRAQHKQRAEPCCAGGRVSVKVFLSAAATSGDVMAAYNSVTSALQVNEIDTLFIALPDNDAALLSGSFTLIWEAVEGLIQGGKIRSAGICELTRSQLESVIKFAKIKPRAVLVTQPLTSTTTPTTNTTTPTTTPTTNTTTQPEVGQQHFVTPALRDLLDYASSQDVTVLSNPASEQNALRDVNTQAVLKKYNMDNGKQWTLRWALRYTVAVNCRTLLSQKGYIMAGDQA